MSLFDLPYLHFSCGFSVLCKRGQIPEGLFLSVVWDLLGLTSIVGAAENQPLSLEFPSDVLAPRTT